MADWAVGDLASLIGTVVQGLLHTLIILGVINGLIDVALIWQCYHYAKWEQFKPLLTFLRIRKPAPATSESSPVALGSPNPTLVATVPETPKKSRWSTILHLVYVLAVVGLSIMVWGVVVARVRKTATLRPGEDGTDPDFSPVGAAFGWVSMVIYTTSRYPQIYKNWKSKSCHNLSIWIFILLVIYNATNISSILIKSRAHNYVIVNLPWIVNSSFNIILDLIIMAQFMWYRKIRHADPVAGQISEVQEERKEPV
ncbi:PQ-loop repeat-containing protein 1 [Ceratobasidium sp. AG-Ba]|nr:PQ-loop repeat-containing protein 1 [Ceratobasidium sp. AG-Ba]